MASDSEARNEAGSTEQGEDKTETTTLSEYQEPCLGENVAGQAPSDDTEQPNDHGDKRDEQASNQVSLDSKHSQESSGPDSAIELGSINRHDQSNNSLPQSKYESAEMYKLREFCMKHIEGRSCHQRQDDPAGKSTDSILTLLVTDDLSSIRDTELLRAFFIEYLNLLPPKVISETLSVLIAIVKKSVFHLESARGLLFSCLNYLLSNNNRNESKSSLEQDQSGDSSNLGLTKHFLREWVHLLIAHSCDVEELKSVLKLSEQDPTLLNFIQQANLKQRNRPHAFFAFPGTRGSMISLPPFQKWPVQLGWSFSTWFFLEPKSCAQPYLYNFKTGKTGLGFSAHFTGNCLVLTSIRVKGKGIQHCIAYEFPSYKWIHCAITYHNKWRASEIKVYVNGQLTANIEMPWQVQTTEMFDKCFIGGSSTLSGKDRSGDLNCFCGQMSAIYLFNEGLSAAQICAIHRLGPSYMGQFKYSNESHVNLPPQICKTLYEEKLASSLFCLFTPVAVDSGTLCIQLAPFKSSTSASAQNYFLSAPHAALLGQTKAIITQPICSTLQSLGCSKSLLPLLNVFANKDNPDACASLIGFLCDLLESSPHWFANEIVQNNGFVVIACALSSNSRLLISERLLDIFLSLARTLLTTSSTAGDSLLLKHLMDNILLNPSLWVYADTKLQIKLYSYMANEFIRGTRHGSNKYTMSSSSEAPTYFAYNPTSNATSSIYNQGVSNPGASPDDQSKYNDNVPPVADLLFSEIRRVSTVLQSLHALKYYYWMVEEKTINHKARNNRLRPSHDDLAIIRSHILSFIKELILRATTTPLDEIQGLLNYISACSHPENLIDALDMLSSLVAEHPTTMVAAMDQKQAIMVLFSLIGSDFEIIRIKSLKILSLFLSQCSHKKKQDMMGPNNLFMLLCDRLRVHKPMTLELYEALIDLLIEENNSDRYLDDKRAKELSKKRIENSLVIKVIATLIHEERTVKLRSDNDVTTIRNSLEPAKIDIRQIFINDLWNLIVNSKENRRIILQMSVWQHWLINLIDSTIDDSQLVRDQILAIFRVLLYHAIRYEYGGWRVWIDTLAIIHAKVSFDEFCQRMSRDFTYDDEHLQQPQAANQVAQDDQKDPSTNINNDNRLNEVNEAKSDSESGEREQDVSKQTIVSSISEHVPNANRGIEMSSEEPAIDEPDGGKGNDKVDDKISLRSEDHPRSNEINEDTGTPKPEEPLDSTDLAPSRAFRKMSVADDEPGVQQQAMTSNDDASDNDEQLDETINNSQLTRQHSLTSIPLEEPSPIQNNVDAEEPATEVMNHSVEDENTMKNQGDTHVGSSGPQSIQSQHKVTTSPAFRIPEFRWCSILIKLLNDLMFSIECDLYHWRCLAKLTSLDVPPFTPKSVGLSANQSASSSNATKGSQSTANAQLDSILQKTENQIYIINVIHIVSQLADNVIIAAGGLLPLLADATGGNKGSSGSSSSASNSTKLQTTEGLTLSQANSLLYRLVNMVDMVVFAATHINFSELEADKNSTSGGILRQCLRLACTVTVKNCLILRNLGQKISSLDMEANISTIELPSDLFDSYQGCSLLSTNGLFENSALTLEATDLIADLEYSPHQTPNTTSMPSILPFQTNPIKDPKKLLQLIDISRIQTCIYYDGSTDSRQSQFLALSSLYFISVLMVSKYRDIIEPKNKITGHKNGRSSHGSQKDLDGLPSGSSRESQASGNANNSQPVSSIEANLLNFGAMQPNNPAPTPSALTNMLTTRLEDTLNTVCPLLKSIMCDFCAFLSKTLIGSHGQDLVNKEAERTFRRVNTSPVELVMLLCSQEWQNTLQKNAGLAFIELINEGRVLSHGMKDHIVRVAMEAEFILSRLRADDVAKHEHFGLACSDALANRLHEEVLINSLISSAARRDYMVYCKFKEMVQSCKNYKLDIWEDDDRRKRRFVFDSWDDTTQKFYVPSHGQTDDDCVDSKTLEATSTSNDNQQQHQISSSDDTKTDTSRIIELQKSIEMGGIDNHCSPVGAINASSMSGSPAEHPNDQRDESDDYDPEEEDDHSESCQDHHGDLSASGGGGGGSPNQTNVANLKADLGGESSGPNGQQTKLHVAYPQSALKNHHSASGNGHHSNRGDISEDFKDNQAWDYDDCGSVNEVTGSVVFAAECSLIWSIYSIPGVLQITTHDLYFEPNQNINDAIDSLKRSDPCTSDHQQQQNEAETCLRSLRSNHSDSSGNVGDQVTLRKIDLEALRYCDFLTCNGKCSLNDIRAIFSRHYLLQPNALEIFLAQRTSVMFAFSDFDIVKRVVKYLPPVGVGIKYGIPQSRRASLMSPRQLFAASNMTQKWQKREIGNFQYLMYLNTIAGRSYQDLNQYPVFPWILTNYESDELDLNLPTNFRDLSKPIGALNNKRRQEFIERYQSWDNPKVPAFHYGTHYSTAAFTLNWLCRLRGTYNSSYLALQDGKYEEDSRLFLSIGDSWVSSLVGGQQNVKELIPEFFYLPEMFHSNLGLPEIEYPPWAKSAEQFVRVHRIALESELVSCQLHQWIDLIFGYKQRGPEAINSVNTFYYLTYQGNVNLNMIQDPALREAVETQIKHFGQTPSQLTTEPHPPRFSALHASPLMFSTGTDEINKVIKFPFNNPVVHISSCINNYIAPTVSVSDGAMNGTPNNPNSECPSSILTITSNNQYQIHKWMPNSQSGHPFTIDPQLDNQAFSSASSRRQLIDVDDMCPAVNLKLANYGGGSGAPSDKGNDTPGGPVDGHKMKGVADEVQLPSTHYIVTLNGKYIIMGSFYDNSFRVFTTESGKLCQVIYGHRGPITCLTRSEGNAAGDFYIATGSQDCSLLIWTWNERFAQVEGSGVSAVHNPMPKLSISGHQTPVLSATICAELGLVISGSKNLILVHTTASSENLLQIDVSMPDIMDRTLSESRSLHAASYDSQASIQRPKVQDKQKTILEASMLGDDTARGVKGSHRITTTADHKGKSTPTSSRSQSPTSVMKDEKFTQLKSLCCSDYYITNLQLSRELAFIVCVALPPPRKKSRSGDEGNFGGRSSPALLLTFNLKGSLIDSVPIGHSVSSPKLGDACFLQTSRDGEHLILNDSPITIKIYKTFGLQPIYAYNTNDIPNALSEDQNRIRSMVLLEGKYILVGLENGKIIVYNSEFKNLH